MAEYCPEKLNPDRYNWGKDSWAIAEFCPEKLDTKRYNWQEESYYVVVYCPHLIDPERINWDDIGLDERIVECYAPEWLDEYKKHKKEN